MIVSPQNSMAVDTTMLEVDSCRAICGDNDLQLCLLFSFLKATQDREAYLVIVAISASADLHAVLQLIRARQHATAKLVRILRLRVVQADHKQGRIDNVEASFVVLVLGQNAAQARPHFSVLGRQDADGALGDLTGWDFVGVADYGLQVEHQRAFGEEGSMVRV